MSKINKLIKEKCYDVIEYRKIEDLFTMLTGMTGVSNKWAESGNCRFIDYMNVYKNKKVDTKLLHYATVNNSNQTDRKSVV